MNKQTKLPIVVPARARPDEKTPRRRTASDPSARPGHYARQSPLSPQVKIDNPLGDFSEQTGAAFG